MYKSAFLSNYITSHFKISSLVRAYMKACRIFSPRNCGILPKDPIVIFRNTSYAHGTKSRIRFVHEHSGSTICEYKSGSRQYYVLEKYSTSRLCIGERSQTMCLRYSQLCGRRPKQQYLQHCILLKAIPPPKKLSNN